MVGKITSLLYAAFLPCYRLGCFRAQDVFKAVRSPPGFIVETNLFIKVIKIRITIYDIESDTVLELTQTNRAKVHRSGVTLS